MSLFRTPMHCPFLPSHRKKLIRASRTAATPLSCHQDASWPTARPHSHAPCRTTKTPHPILPLPFSTAHSSYLTMLDPTTQPTIPHRTPTHTKSPPYHTSHFKPHQPTTSNTVPLLDAPTTRTPLTSIPSTNSSHTPQLNTLPLPSHPYSLLFPRAPPTPRRSRPTILLRLRLPPTTT